MSDPKIISPLLDGFTLGAPICEHNGVICCPAIRENTTKKYIIKIITVPPSQSQLDALLLAGAYKDPADAMEYFRRIGEDILQEAELLKNLSKLEGFLPYDGWQMEPITRRRLGYEIYLVGSYKRSLEKYMARNAFTHLEAINLALDLCSALSVCRQSGYLYADLKPSNVYVSEKKEYRIGDLGFLKLDALRYASLPERYYSPYTPPELFDPMVSVNLSADTYALGMILYQLYNDGHLPFKGLSPTEPLPTPVHADYEMAEIIMKAIHPDPEQRWTDPKDLGKAIASYMQRNSVNDIPITPFIPLDVQPEPIVETKSSDDLPEKTAETVDSGCITESDIADSPTEADSKDEQPADTPEEENPLKPEAAFQESSPVEAAEIAEPTESAAPKDAEAESMEQSEKQEPAVVKDAPDSPAAEVAVIQEDQYEDAVLSEEVAKIIAKADDLIAHEIPEETVFHVEPEQDPFAFAYEDSARQEDDSPTESSGYDDSVPEEAQEKKQTTKHFADVSGKKKAKKFFGRVFILLLLCAAAACGLWFYQNIYLQTVDSISVSGTQDTITVLIDTAVEESKLVVHCTDSNGNKISEAVQGGKVSFANLKPSTQYTLEVDMAGFHKLTGETSEVFTTDATTKVLTFQAVAGAEDGSVILEFTVDGNDPDFWNIRYSAEGEEERRETVTSHSATITGLTVGKVYTFTLDGGKNFDLSGETTLQYMASKLILAENMHITSETGNEITIRWDNPGDVVVENWRVYCYDGYGFEEGVTVSDTKAVITGLTPGVKYVVEVTASGMTQPSRMEITESPIHISAYHMDESSKTELKVSWDFTGEAPEDGWQLHYTVDGGGDQVVACQKASASVTPLIPNATYRFSLSSADGRTVFNNVAAYETADAAAFADNNVKLENFTFELLKTPEDESWHYESLQNPEFTTTFGLQDSASMVLRSSSTFYMPGYETKALYVFRNAYDTVMPDATVEETFYWKDIWSAGDLQTGELNIPRLPSYPGDYVMELYFNGKFVTEFSIKMVE